MQYGDFAKLYDTLMSDVDYDGWASYIEGFIPEDASVLECACGTGEITLRLAKAGHSIVATDVSEDMLRVASEKLRLSGAAAKRVHFARMDMRETAVHKPVDCVVCCCDGVNYLLSREDVKRFFMSASSALRSGGLLLFDISSRYKLKELLGQNCFADNDADHPYIWQNTYDAQSKLLRMELAFFIKQGELYSRIDEAHIQRAHSVKEISSWLEECGYEYDIYKCFGTETPDDTTERIQFVARKL